MLKTGNFHNCTFCKKQFHHKFNYDRHVLCCEFIHKSTKERENDIDITHQLPTQHEMYQLMQHMMMRIHKLEDENTKLKRFKKNKLNALEWLNDQTKCAPPTISFSDWIRTHILPSVKEYLDIVFKNGLLSGLIAVFENSISQFNISDIPVCSFDSNLSVIYVYKKNTVDATTGESDELKWTKISNTDLDKYLRRISNQFSYDFKTCWYDLHKDDIENDEKYSEMYIEYYQQILGGKVSDETRFHKLRQYLSTHTKRNLKSIIEYDIV